MSEADDRARAEQILAEERARNEKLAQEVARERARDKGRDK